jgi:hypothetical protein
MLLPPVIVNIILAIISTMLHHYRMSNYQRQQTTSVATTLPLPLFLSYIKDRVSLSTLKVVGAEFGVSDACISRWLSGKRAVPRMALILGARLMAEPRQLADGLPE